MTTERHDSALSSASVTVSADVGVLRETTHSEDGQVDSPERVRDGDAQEEDVRDDRGEVEDAEEGAEGGAETGDERENGSATGAHGLLRRVTTVVAADESWVQWTYIHTAAQDNAGCLMHAVATAVAVAVQEHQPECWLLQLSGEDGTGTECRQQDLDECNEVAHSLCDRLWTKVSQSQWRDLAVGERTHARLMESARAIMQLWLAATCGWVRADKYVYHGYHDRPFFGEWTCRLQLQRERFEEVLLQRQRERTRLEEALVSSQQEAMRARELLDIATRTVQVLDQEGARDRDRLQFVLAKLADAAGTPALHADIRISETIERIRGQAVATERADRRRLQHCQQRQLASATGGCGGKRRKTATSDYGCGGTGSGESRQAVRGGTEPSQTEQWVLDTLNEVQVPDPRCADGASASGAGSGAGVSGPARPAALATVNTTYEVTVAAVQVERSTVDVDDTGIEVGSSGVVTAVEVAQLTVGNAGIDNGSSGVVAGGDVGAGSAVPGESKR